MQRAREQITSIAHTRYVSRAWHLRHGSLGADGGSASRILQLCFLEEDPRSCWGAFRDYAKAVDAGGVGKATFAAPFIPTIVGTDTYTDQLW